MNIPFLHTWPPRFAGQLIAAVAHRHCFHTAHDKSFIGIYSEQVVDGENLLSLTSSFPDSQMAQRNLRFYRPRIFHRQIEYRFFRRI